MDLAIKDKENWGYLKKKISKIGILNCEDYSDKFLVRRVDVRIRGLNIESYMEYSKILGMSDEEQKLLKKELTIHLTHFFRDKSVYALIKDEVLPILFNLKYEKKDMDLKVWCAGCSSGEEAYSIAILLKEVLGNRFSRFKIKFIATDIDPSSIEKATKGVYEKNQFKETNPEYLRKYFNKENGKYLIKDEIKKIIAFEVGDILRSSHKNQWDIILCRNTIIYFGGVSKLRLYEENFKRLNSGGFLIMGKTETIMGSVRENYQIFSTTEKIYFKE